MVTSILFPSLKQSLSQFDKQYAAAQRRQAALAIYPTPIAVVDALTSSKNASNEERDAILSAILVEQARGVSRLWSTLLAVSFEPMLRGLARRARSTDPQEAEQRALYEFVGVVVKLASARPAQKIAGYLRVATESAFFHGLARDRRGPETVALDDETEAEAVDVAETDRLDEARRIDLLTKLVRAENDGDAILEMLLATSPGSGETLKSYVARVYCAHRTTSARRRTSDSSVLVDRCQRCIDTGQCGIETSLSAIEPCRYRVDSRQSHVDISQSQVDICRYRIERSQSRIEMCLSRIDIANLS